MKVIEAVYREILYNTIEKKQRVITQADLARELSVSLSTVNRAVQNLKNIGSIEVNKRNFHVIDVKKILYYWASIRNLHKDIIYFTRIESPITEIEKNMPSDIIFSVYSAYKFIYDDVPADYSEIYVYGDYDIKKRFPENKGIPNLFVLKKDKLIEKYGNTTTIANTFVDLWNLKEWYAKEFIKALEERLHGILE